MLDKKAKPEGKHPPHADGHGAPKTKPAATPEVIVLHDLRTGPEFEINRFEVRLASLTDEISDLREENRKLMTANQTLQAELRETKLALSKFQLSELRGIDRGNNSWLRSLKML